MKISIITPSYNQRRFLERAIFSVWKQQGDFDLEYIVADGGSTDGSLEVLRKYEQIFQKGSFRHGCRSFAFKWWSVKDRGQSHAINLGFKASSGDILGWLNSDDTYLGKNSLLALLQPFIFSRADIVVGNCYHIDTEDNVIDIPCLINELDNDEFQKKIKRLSNYNFILQPATLFRRNVWEHCFLAENYNYIMDWVFWCSAQKKGLKFVKINTFVATNRLHDKAKTVEGGMPKYIEGYNFFKEQNVWCWNRMYYILYLVLLKAQKIPLMKKVAVYLIIFGKKTRVFLVNNLKRF